MADSLPEITLTSPTRSERARPFTASPVRDPTISSDSNTRGRGRRGWGERPTTPVAASRSRDGRPGSASSWTSPVQLMRSRSKNNGAAQPVNGTGARTDGLETEPQAPSSPLDPLSQHILDRTGSSLNASTASRPPSTDGASINDARQSSDSSRAPAVQFPTRRSTDLTEGGQAHKDLRKGVKAVSFISRLMGGKKRGDEDDNAEEESVSNEDRPEGNDAQVFTEPVHSTGYSPRHSQTPAYIKVRSKYKKQRDFDHLFLAQELEGRVRHTMERKNSSNKLRRKNTFEMEPQTVWAMEFSRDGRYLAAAGVDGIVRVWAVLASPEDRQKHEKQESSEYFEALGPDAQSEHLCSPVFQTQPVREYEGHTATVLDLSWSKNNFLLSSSMDKTVRLWHVSRSECLCTFKHNDFVPSIAFHPKDDRFFLAGSLDSKLRLWSIPDKSVAFTALVPDMITAVAFTPDGKCSMAGCLGGLCMFFDTDGLKYQSQIHVRSTRGQNAKGSKITGIQPFYDATGDTKLLITSNDSRIRLYNFRDKNLEMKIRGNDNNCSQIRAHVSDDGHYVMCGSEDRKAYIWSLGLEEGDRRDRRPVEMFEAHNTITTAACIAPVKTRTLLARSRDPVYDLCNPPPVTLMSQAEHSDSRTSSKPTTESGSIQGTPVEAEAPYEKPRFSPIRGRGTNHNDGGILVTADFMGKIKVFRQDCAWSKRKFDDWDRASLFSKRNGKVTRQGSTGTTASQRSYRDTRSSVNGPSDRILTWRQGIVSTPSVIDGRQLTKTTSRSISPQKLAESLPKAGKTEEPAKGSKLSHSLAVDTKNGVSQSNGDDTSPSPSSQTPHQHSSPEDSNPLMIQGGRSYVFYNTDNWKQQAERMRETSHVASHDRLSTVLTREDEKRISDGAGDGGDPSHLRPAAVLRTRSYVSQLSDEQSTDEEGDEQYDDAPEH